MPLNIICSFIVIIHCLEKHMKILYKKTILEENYVLCLATFYVKIFKNKKYIFKTKTLSLGRTFQPIQNSKIEYFVGRFTQQINSVAILRGIFSTAQNPNGVQWFL